VLRASSEAGRLGPSGFSETSEREGRLNRLLLAFKAFWAVLTDPAAANRIDQALRGDAPRADLTLLGLLQRDGRLIDFLKEEIGGYSDEQIGAAARDIHRGCRAVLEEYLKLEPILDQPEMADVTLAEEAFDASAIQLSGNVGGNPPYKGTLKHHGWRVVEFRTPKLPATKDGQVVIAPAEVEVS